MDTLTTMKRAEVPERELPESKSKTLYFQDITMRYLNEMRLLFRGGKLTKKDNWRNVAEHCVVQLASAEVLADLLDLPHEDRKRLCTVAAVHDWHKRIDVGQRRLRHIDDDHEKRRLQEEISHIETYAQSFLHSVNPDPHLMRATGPEFLQRALVDNNATFLEKLQFYLDDICTHDLVPLKDRIAEVASRRQDLNDDAALTQAIGGKYWDRELELGAVIEREIWERLGGQARGISRPEDLPAFLRTELQRRINAHM